MSNDGLVYCYNVLMRLQHIDLGLKRLNENIDLLAKSGTEKKPVEDVDVEGQISNLSDDSIDKEVSEKLSKEVVSNIIEQMKHKIDDTIEERAKEYSLKDFDGYYTGRESAVEEGYIAGATEQKAIDDAILLKLKSAWEKEAQINHDDEANRKQGYHDAIENACKACENELRKLKRLLDESVGVPANLISVDKSLSAIRKEMEESL